MFFIVTIDATNKHFSPGDTVRGKVHCSIEDTFYTEVRVRLIGEECSYYDGSGENDAIAKDNSWKAIFLQTQNVIIRSGCFDIGDYSFPFHLSLPKLVPSTYTDKCGYVKYCVRATITVRGKEAKEDEEKFKVFSPIDLNDVTNLSSGESTHSEALVVNTWWCIGETVRMDVKLRKNAFVLGEVIHVGVKLANNSYLTVSMVKIELYVRIATKVPSLRPFVSTEQLLTSDRLAGLSSYRSSTYTSRLKIPEVVQLLNFQKCTLFSQRCILEVTAEFEKSSKRKLKVEVELMLGHIPIGGFKDTEGQKPLPPQASPHSSDSRVAPLPADLFQPPKRVPYPPESTFTRQKPLPSEASQPQPNTLDLYPPERQNLPYPPNDQLNPLPINDSLPPYPIADSCPYPTNKYETNHPFPIPSSKEQIKRSLTLNPPYPNSNSCPYPTGKDETNHPLPIPSSKEQIKRSLTLNPPYPNSNSCPYPTGKDETNHPLPIPSSKEQIKRSLALNPPYPNSNTCPYPSGKDETNHPLQIPSSKEQIKRSLTLNPPYPNSNSCPYPTDKDETNHPLPIPSSKERNFNPSYPNSSNCPYPIETFGTQLQTRLTSNSPSFKETPVPLPPNTPFTRGAPYPVTSPPYPTTDHPDLKNSNVPRPTSANVAPYPPEQLPSHLTVGFAEFMPMPMPMEYSPMEHRSVGFAVPTSRDDEPKDTSETLVRPSAPLLSDIKTPPIADMKELDDILWADASSVSSEDSYLDSRPSDLTIPQLPTPPATDLPLPSLPATNTELVKRTETSVHSDASSAKEEAGSSLKEKKKRLQRKLAQAI